MRLLKTIPIMLASLINLRKTHHRILELVQELYYVLGLQGQKYSSAEWVRRQKRKRVSVEGDGQ